MSLLKSEPDIVTARLHTHHLSDTLWNTPEQVVAYYGAVQAQDYAAAKWSLGQRIARSTDPLIEQAYNEGRILRTHVMRPTWHFVSPADIRWMQMLTAHRVKALMRHYNRKLELDDALFARCKALIVREFKNFRYLTRQQIKKILESIGVKTDVQRLAHIVMGAELDAVICSGPRIGKQFSYALLEERVPKVKKMNHDEALANLALRYFTSHGPAQIRDFSWWSGLTMKEVQEGIDMVASQLEHETVKEKTYWFRPHIQIRPIPSPLVRLLSIYDEYTIAYKDRSLLGDENFSKGLFTMGVALSSVLTIDGKVVGTWKRTLKKKSVDVQVKPLRPLSAAELRAVDRAVESYRSYLSL